MALSDNIIRNGGASNTTDWTNPSSGVAQYWAAVAGSKSIITGSNWNGNAQKIERVVTALDQNYLAIYQTDANFLTTPPTTGGYGRLSFKYRSSNPELSYFTIWGTFNGTYGVIGAFSNNTNTTPQFHTVDFDWTDGALEDIVFGRWNTSPRMPLGTYYLELDEISVIVDTVPIPALNTSEIRVSSNWKDIDFSGSKIRVGGAWKDIAEVKQRIGGAWETIY